MKLTTNQKIIITFSHDDWSESYEVNSSLGLLMLQNLTTALSTSYYQDDQCNKIACIKNLRHLSGELTMDGKPVLTRLPHSEEASKHCLGLKAAKLLIEKGWPF